MGHRGKLSRKEDKKGYDCDIQIKMKHFEPFRLSVPSGIQKDRHRLILASDCRLIKNYIYIYIYIYMLINFLY